ncbi:MAG: VPLPA-CTERM sorting domain-containing protein [Paracoccaceae bacterium]
MKHLLICVSALAMASPALGETVIMTFDEVAGDYTDFDDTIGDSTNVDVTNDTVAGFGNTAVTVSNVDHWTNNYSELTDVAFAATNGQVGQFSFAIDAGYELTFDSFDFGNYSGGVTARDASFRIYDGAWGLVWQSDVTGHTGASVNMTPGVTLSGAAYFQWGTDWNIGIDNFTYSVAEIAPAVPLPAGLPLLLTGLVGFGALRRRKG